MRLASFAFVTLSAGVASGFAAISCSSGDTGSGGHASTSSSGGVGGAGGGSGGAGGGSAVVDFTPEGCAFSIASRPEYGSFAVADATVGAHPNIRRVRLGLGGNITPGAKGHADPSTSIAFAWQTDDDGTLASDVAWGTDPNPAMWSAKDRTSGVTWLTPHGTLGATADERMHEAYVCGLTPASTYYYRVGGGPAGHEVWSDVLSFTTTPAAGATPITIGIHGDSRGEINDAWQLVQKRFFLAGTTFDVFSGDVINLAPDQGEWEEWLDKAEKDQSGYLTLGQRLTLSTHGNHENHTALFYGNLVLPQEPANYPDTTELFYSVDVGPVHLVVFDDFWIADAASNPAYEPVVKKWLEADLTKANANRSNVPWIVTNHHHGPFSSSTHGMDADVLQNRAFLVPLYDQFHVDLDVAGHDHNYERSKPLTGPAAHPTIQSSPADGTTYVICAGAGADAYGSGTSSFTATSHAFGDDGGYGTYGVLSVSPSTLTLVASELRGDGSDPMIDTFTATK
jgi:acid phosphatase type 7